MAYLRQKRGVDFVLETHAGVSLEDARIIKAVRIFEERNALIDKALDLDERINRIEKNSRISQKIKDFLNKKFLELYLELSSTVIDIYPKGSDVVRRLAIMREEVPSNQHGSTHFLPQDAAEEIFDAEEKYREIEEAQTAKTWVQRAVTAPQTARAKYLAQQEHSRVISHAVSGVEEQVVSFLTTADAHWSDGKSQKYEARLSEIDKFVSLVETVASYLGEAQGSFIRPLAQQCALALLDYTKDSSPDSFQKANRLIIQLSGIAETKPEDVIHHVLEWKLRVDRDESDALAVVAARQAISPGSFSPEIEASIIKVRETAEIARGWFFEMAEKIQNGEISPHLFYQIVNLLENQKAMMDDIHLSPFYNAIASLESVHRPKQLESTKPTLKIAQEKTVTIESNTVFKYPNLLDEPGKFLEFSNQLYKEQDLPEWQHDIDLESRIKALNPIKRALIERELSEGAIAILMPGRAVQEQTLAKAIRQLKPLWIENGERKTVKASYQWNWIEKLVQDKNEALFQGIPESPYILLTKPTQAPPQNTVLKSLGDQKKEFARMKQERPELHVANVSGYIALQSWATRLQNREGVQDIQPLDRETFTRFIDLPISGDFVPCGIFHSGYGRLRLDGSFAADPHSRCGFRLEVMVEV